MVRCLGSPSLRQSHLPMLTTKRSTLIQIRHLGKRNCANAAPTLGVVAEARCNVNGIIDLSGGECAWSQCPPRHPLVHVDDNFMEKNPKITTWKLPRQLTEVNGFWIYDGRWPPLWPTQGVRDHWSRGRNAHRCVSNAIVAQSRYPTYHACIGSKRII